VERRYGIQRWYKDGNPYVWPEGTLKRHVLALLLCVVPVAAFAASPKPEEWDVERRLAERFDPVKNGERMAAELVKNPNAAPRPEENSPDARHYVIDGARNPELFLPHELFEGLLTAFQPDEFMQDAQRELYGRLLGEFGWDAEMFWPTLEQLSADYLQLRYRTESADPTARCRARFEALQQARKAFGMKEFDAFLYRAIAPHGQSALVTNEPNPAARLRHEARGCP
jgi:hypothetical protein